MKLNEKGLKRLLDVAFDGDEFYQSNALQIEFEPDDFDGCFQNGKDHVVLTVEEAKEMRHLMFGLEMEGVVPCDEFKDMRNNLKKRIEQAENK